MGLKRQERSKKTRMRRAATRPSGFCMQAYAAQALLLALDPASARSPGLLPPSVRFVTPSRAVPWRSRSMQFLVERGVICLAELDPPSCNNWRSLPRASRCKRVSGSPSPTIAEIRSRFRLAERKMGAFKVGVGAVARNPGSTPCRTSGSVDDPCGDTTSGAGVSTGTCRQSKQGFDKPVSQWGSECPARRCQLFHNVFFLRRMRNALLITHAFALLPARLPVWGAIVSLHPNSRISFRSISSWAIRVFKLLDARCFAVDPHLLIWVGNDSS